MRGNNFTIGKFRLFKCPKSCKNNDQKLMTSGPHQVIYTHLERTNQNKL